MPDTLIDVDCASKKFCRSLKRALWYGVCDIGAELTGQPSRSAQLRAGEFWALKDVSLQVRRGECLGLVGPNGAGKSTLLKMLNGLIKPDTGRIAMRGRVGALIELGTGFNPVLTGRENIYTNASVLGMGKREVDGRLEDIIDFAEIGDAIDAPVRTYSSGMKVRLGFAVAAFLRPDVLLVDEVLAVGDMQFKYKCFEHILGLKKEGVCIVLVTHNTTNVARVCDRTVVISAGQKSFDGSVPEGIAAYEKSMLYHTGTDQHDPRQPVRIAGARLFNQRGLPTNQFHTDDGLKLEIRLAVDRPIDGVRLRAAFRSPTHGHLGGFCSPYTGFTPVVRPPETCILLTVPRLPLLLGYYWISLGVYGSKMTDVYDIRDMACDFDVIGPRPKKFGYDLDGVFKLEHRWSQPVQQPAPPIRAA